MRQLPLLAVVFVLVFPAQLLAQAAAGGEVMQAVEGEAARDPAGLPRSEDAKEGASQSFDGLGLTIKTLAPSRIVDINGSSFNGTVKEERPLQKDAPEIEEEQSGEVPEPGEESGRNDKDHKYHFDGKVTGIPSLTIYTAKKDKPGENNNTTKPTSSGWREWLPKALLFGGIAASIAGFFFPPLLFLGGLLLGGYGMWKMMGAKD